MSRTAQTILYIFLLTGNLWARETLLEGSDQYQVTFETTHPDRIKVKAILTLEDSLLYMSPFGPMPERWSEFIQNIKAKDGDGGAITVSRQEEGKGWVLKDFVVGQTLYLEYDMVLEHEALDWPGGIDGVAYKREWGIMTTGRSLFIMNGKLKRKIRVSFNKPDSWKVSVPWQPIGGTDKSYIVPDLTALQESFLFAGSHEEEIIRRDGFTLKFVLGGEKVKGEASRFVNVASGVMDYYISLMGGIPKGGMGKELEQCLVIISQSEHVDGEVIGNHLSMFMNPDGNPMDQMIGWFMFAHEFFHLWNGKTLRFADTSTDWFKEGISNYYTIKALKQTGFIKEDVVLGMLNNLFYQRYIHDPGYGSLSPSRAASGFDKDNHWGLVYGGGLFAGIAIDLEIRHRTENADSLDDLMRELYAQYGDTEKLIVQDDILKRANHLGTTDFTGFMQEHILGPLPISLQPYLKYAGVLVETSGDQLKLTHIVEKSHLQNAIWEGFLGGN